MNYYIYQMKKIFITYFLILIGISTFSQSIKILDKRGNLINGNEFEVSLEDSVLYPHQFLITLDTNIKTDIPVFVTKHNLNVCDGTTNSFAWDMLYTPAISFMSPFTSTLANTFYLSDSSSFNDTILFGTYHYDDNNSGSATFKYEFHSDSLIDTASFILKISAPGECSITQHVNETLQNKILYNNESGKITLKSSNYSNLEFEIINMKGQVCYKQNIDSKSIKINKSIFNEGVYFLRLFRNNYVISTKKIIIHK